MTVLMVLVASLPTAAADAGATALLFTLHLFFLHVRVSCVCASGCAQCCYISRQSVSRSWSSVRLVRVYATSLTSQAVLLLVCWAASLDSCLSAPFWDGGRAALTDPSKVPHEVRTLLSSGHN
jgi:hypothetical protein